RQTQVRVPQRPADGTVVILIDVARAQASAVMANVVVQRAPFAELAADVDREGALVEIQRPHGAQVRGARETEAGDVRVRRLVDDDTRQQLGGVLVELDGTVVAGARLLAAVEQRGGEVRRETADRDALRAAIHALRGQTRQARDGFTDGDVGQLA